MAMTPRSARAHQCPASAGSAGCGWVIPSSLLVAATRVSRCADTLLSDTLYARDSQRRQGRWPPYAWGRREGSAAGERRALRLLADDVPAGSFGPVEGRVGGVGQFLVGGSVLGIAGDAYGDGRRGGYAVPLEGMCFDAAPHLLGHLQGFLFGELGEDALVLVAPEACGASPLFFVHGADDASV